MARSVLRFTYESYFQTDFQGGLQIGGGINQDNARDWLEAGASKVREQIIRPLRTNLYLPLGHCDFLPFSGRSLLAGAIEVTV